ncbi:RepB family plasmid replication initiator protein [Erysipelatoclostridium ramosum]|uniref:replication initiation protein n=1 Tax=Coprobacillaceae TaxID=2810280 RepID=UPI0012E8FA94|nr:replication initiation protein [Thomasclavelia ramosa]MDD8035833.1 replication initiation protein [Thomasclavelia ramosa]
MLRIYLDCVDKYPEFKELNRNVLTRVKKEINEKSNIYMDYKKIKTGRSITSILFTFKWKSKADVIDVKTKVHQEPMNQTEQMELEEFLKEFK